jgi:SAM-dependent methyltransferase
MRPISDHNHCYLAENRKDRPREFFKFLRTLAARQLAQNPASRVLDVGCANGEFLYYLHLHHPHVQAAGLDVNEEVLAIARELVPSARFSVGDIETGQNLPTEQFDLVFMNGVNYLLSDHRRWLRNLISLCRGTVYVFGVFNPEDLDFSAVVTRPGDSSSSIPWNLVSQRSVSRFLDEERPGIAHRFHNWEVPVDVPRAHEDPMRCWTLLTDGGRRLQINGLQIVHPLAILEIEVREVAAPHNKVRAATQ